MASDYGGNTIGASAFANPISVSLSETGGAGHAFLKINGVNVGTSGSLAFPTDTLTINYDGAASSGYTDTVSFAAAGSTTSTVRMSPMILTGSVNPTGAGNTANITITEANAPGSVAYTQSLTGCGGVATVPGAGAGSGPSGAAAVTDTLQPAGGKACTLTISDNLGSSISLPVSIPAGVPICASSPINTQINSSKVANGTPCVPSAGSSISAKYGSYSGLGFFLEARDMTTFSETDNCAGKATISPTSFSGSATPSGSANGNFVVTSTITSGTGSCSMTVNDGNGQTVTYPITLVDPYNYSCSNQPYGTIMDPSNKSAGTPCLIGDFPLSGSHSTTLSVGAGASVTISYQESNTTSVLNISTTCHGFSVPATLPNNGGGPYPFDGVASGNVTGRATAADVGTSCTITASADGESTVDTLTITP